MVIAGREGSEIRDGETSRLQRKTENERGHIIMTLRWLSYASWSHQRSRLSSVSSLNCPLPRVLAFSPPPYFSFSNWCSQSRTRHCASALPTLLILHIPHQRHPRRRPPLQSYRLHCCLGFWSGSSLLRMMMVFSTTDCEECSHHHPQITSLRGVYVLCRVPSPRLTPAVPIQTCPSRMAWIAGTRLTDGV